METTYTPAFKAQVALEAIKEQETLEALAQRFNIPAALILEWKQHFIESAGQLFDRKKAGTTARPSIRQLTAKLKRLEQDRDFLKYALKKLEK
jgi:transposase